jgi:serine/threonine-protein kinase
MTDAERTQFIARTPPPPIALRRTEYPPDEDDSRRTGLIWAAVVIALLLVIGAAAYAIVFLGKDDNGSKSVAIPGVVGQTPAAAEALIRQAKLVPKPGGTTGGACDGGQTVDEGKVCTVSPASGQEVKQGSEVTYRVFKKATVQVPFVEGEQYTKAVNDLNKVNLKATKKDVDNEAPAGTVLHQHTAQFTQVPPGTNIVLDVSTGKLKLPDVRGKTYDQAQSQLQGASFNNVSQGAPVITGDQAKDGKVATENPAPGKAYDPNQTVTLRVYQYQAPTPTCTSLPPSATPPPSGTPTGGTTGTALPPC